MKIENGYFYNNEMTLILSDFYESMPQFFIDRVPKNHKSLPSLIKFYGKFLENPK